MSILHSAETVVVLDFETTGLSPDYGDRAIEIGAVKLVDGVVAENFQQLMYPGKRISPFIENYTGITNGMLKQAPSSKQVMAEFAEFISGYNLVAHNASFDCRFLQSELKRIRCRLDAEFACSMLIARRVYQDAPDHKLGTLVSYRDLPCEGTFHRALADAEMTAHLWLAMLQDLRDEYALGHISFEVMRTLSCTPKKSVPGLLARLAEQA